MNLEPFVEAIAAAIVFGIFLGFCLSDYLRTARTYRSREGKHRV